MALYDSFDPDLRLARSPREWAEAFEASFDRMHSALHAVIAEPQVLVSGALAASTFEFCARIQRADGTANGVICRTSHVFGLRDGGWQIVREHTSGRTVPVEEVERLLEQFEPDKLAMITGEQGA